MNIGKRISNIENNLNKSGEVVFRLTGCNGRYPEQEEDIKNNRNVLLISVPGRTCEELRKWAE